MLRRRRLHVRMTAHPSALRGAACSTFTAGSAGSSPRRSATTSIEAVVAITAGTIASSAALIGFGLDSTIEVLSAAAVAWQFTRRDPERWEKGTCA